MKKEGSTFIPWTKWRRLGGCQVHDLVPGLDAGERCLYGSDLLSRDLESAVFVTGSVFV